MVICPSYGRPVQGNLSRQNSTAEGCGPYPWSLLCNQSLTALLANRPTPSRALDPIDVAERAQELVEGRVSQFSYGPTHQAMVADNVDGFTRNERRDRHALIPAIMHIEAAAAAAEISKHALLAAADALGVVTRRGEWRLPG